MLPDVPENGCPGFDGAAASGGVLLLCVNGSSCTQALFRKGELITPIGSKCKWQPSACWLLHSGCGCHVVCDHEQAEAECSPAARLAWWRPTSRQPFWLQLITTRHVLSAPADDTGLTQCLQHEPWLANPWVCGKHEPQPCKQHANARPLLLLVLVKFPILQRSTRFR